MTDGIIRPSVSAPASSSAVHRFSFTGNANEYFGIFIVNLCLTILTLGIYSAWAKVRTQRYFYGSTELDGHRFEYLAEPMQILIGRIIVVAAIAIYSIATQVQPLAILIILPMYLIALPYVINRGLRFNARMTAYRNIRFDWHGTYWRTAWVYLILPFLIVFSAGLLLPFSTRAANRYSAEGHSFGTARLEAAPPIGRYYGALGAALVPALAILALLAIVFATRSIWVVDVGAGDAASQIGATTSGFSIFHWFIVSLYFTFFMGAVIYSTRCRNILVNHLVLDGRHRFRSDLRSRRIIWIAVTNILAVVCTIGLLYPWTRVRMTRYQLDNTALVAQGSLDTFTDVDRPYGNVAASEYMAADGIGAF
ncbi:MAG: DUF898 domain-containing protein [Rhizobiaceae bacterium]|nr:DUF898 domain-containing protein [Rhizobiaceae bacterium]